MALTACTFAERLEALKLAIEFLKTANWGSYPELEELVACELSALYAPPALVRVVPQEKDN